ncbi:hypothetical protein DENSPDRAFT_841533 [Dentipellis sp. KUC8613]|nr:hypothetical protein DENSPDRAFT_841533 [Dentipellis sp. KUC8613]
MDFFFCLPIFFGCPTKIKPEGDQTPRVCPRCHNASVMSAKSRTWFELCFIPLVPMRAQHIWICGICQWSVPLQPGWEPVVPNAGYVHPNAGGGARGLGGPGPGSPWAQAQGGFQPGYQPAYFPNQPPPK